MSKKKKNPETKSKTIQRAITLVLGLGFAGSSLAIALVGFFGQQGTNTAQSGSPENSQAAAAEQLQVQIKGYEKVLKREPKNSAALKGLAQIHMQTGDMQKAAPVLEKIVKYYPEEKEVAAILQIIKQQEAARSANSTSNPAPKPEKGVTAPKNSPDN